MLRPKLNAEFPGTMFYFLPADMITQILNFGLPAPIDVQVDGANSEGNRQLADRLLNRIRQVPGMVDLRIQQPFDQPKLHITCRPDESGTGRIHAVRHRRRPARLAQRQFPDHAHVLPEPEERSHL